VVKGKIAPNLEEALKFCDEVGYPVIAKPDIGVGANGTLKIENDEHLKLLGLSLDFKRNYFFEEFVEGTIVTFDGLTDKHRNIVFFTSHVYSEGVMEVVNKDSHVYYYSLRDIPPDLEAAGRKIIEVFDLRERFFHVEFFRKADNSLICLEINFRPPGGYSMDMFNFAIDDDLYQFWADLCTDQRTEFPYERKYHVLWVSRKRQYKYKYSVDQIMTSIYAPNIVFSQPLPRGLHLMGQYGFIFRSPDLEEVTSFQSFVWECS